MGHPGCGGESKEKADSSSFGSLRSLRVRNDKRTLLRNDKTNTGIVRLRLSRMTGNPPFRDQAAKGWATRPGYLVWNNSGAKWARLSCQTIQEWTPGVWT